jgi:hypothetical protein
MDEGLRHLVGLKSPGILVVKGTGVTDSGVAAIKQLLPRLTPFR